MLPPYIRGAPLASFRLSVRGPFDGPDDVLDPNRHQITVQVSAGLFSA
jgi:hypothetical protein